MKLCEVSELFDVRYGNGFELVNLEPHEAGYNFVARTKKNNGVVAKVSKVLGCEPFPKGLISVAVSGSVMESFLQPAPFYTAYHVMVLAPKVEMSDAVKLYYCHCLRQNKFKYSYGRQANTTLPHLLVPALEEVPAEVRGFDMEQYRASLLSGANVPELAEEARVVGPLSEQPVPLSDLFEVHNGLSSQHVLRSKRKESDNWIPFIRPSYKQATSIDAYVNKSLIPEGYIYPKGTLYVSTDGQGSHTYAYVSAFDFVPNSNVSVLMPKRPMCLREKLFYALCITSNRFKFSYGRKPKGDKLKKILLPPHIPLELNRCSF